MRNTIMTNILHLVLRYRRILTIISGILLVIILICVVFAGFSSRRIELEIEKTGKVVGPTFQAPSVRADGSLEYKNLLLGFSLFYPNDLLVQEIDDGSSASTIVFKSKVGTSGFQVFVVPYDLDHVTAEQFAKDSPSGIMSNPLQVLIDGQKATLFFGRDDIMGDTREVWFIKDGFLYEVSAPKEFDDWLGNIMKTWRFI